MSRPILRLPVGTEPNGRDGEDYARRARQHRPTDRDALRCAAQELASRGLRAADIAHSLDLTVPATLELLGQPTKDR